MGYPTNFPNGVSSFGILQSGQYPAMIPRPAQNGAVYFVDNVNGADFSDGLSPQTAFLTIAKALTLAKTDGGTTIFILETNNDYTENLLVTVRGVTLVGVSQSGDHVTIAPAAGIPLRVRGGLTQGATTRAHNFSAFNLQFHSADSSAACQQQANRYLYNNCDFIADGGGIGLRLFPNNLNNSETASEGYIVNCWIRQCTGSAGMTFEAPAPSAGGTGGTGVTGTVVDSCLFYGNTNQDILDVNAGGSNLAAFGSTGNDCVIQRCYFADNKHGSAYITLTGTNDVGLVANSWFADRTGLTATEIHLNAGHTVVAAGLISAKGITDSSAF